MQCKTHLVIKSLLQSAYSFSSFSKAACPIIKLLIMNWVTGLCINIMIFIIDHKCSEIFKRQMPPSPTVPKIIFLM